MPEKYLRTFFDDKAVIVEDPTQEIIVHKSSQARGEVGWEIRLRKRPRETAESYLRRVVETHRRLERDIGPNRTPLFQQRPQAAPQN